MAADGMEYIFPLISIWQSEILQHVQLKMLDETELLHRSGKPLPGTSLTYYE
jgi:hypothetical protein